MQESTKSIDVISTVFVTSATGMQSSAIARQLLRNGKKVIGLTRKVDGVEQENVKMEEVNYSSVEFLTNIFLSNLVNTSETSALIYTPPLGADGLGMLTRLMEAASNAKVSLFIVNLGGRIFEGHISPITDAKQALAKACLSYANHDRKAYVLEPTTYMENIVAPWAIKRLLQHNTFEYPKGHLPWISHKTLGECVNVLVDKVNELPSGHIKIQGPESLLGPAVAAQLSTGMKKTISYEHLPFSAFGLMLDHIFGAPVGSIISD